MLFDLKFLGQILVIFPLDVRTNCLFIYEITRIADLFLIQVSLLQDVVIEKFIWREDESQFEAGFGIGRREIRDANVEEVFESICMDCAMEGGLKHKI